MNPIQIQQGWRIENYEIASLGKTISDKLVREMFSGEVASTPRKTGEERHHIP